MKTKQLIAKRIKITNKAKVVHRCCGQNHFNARESGKIVRNKRQSRTLSKSLHQTIIRSI